MDCRTEASKYGRAVERVVRGGHTELVKFKTNRSRLKNIKQEMLFVAAQCGNEEALKMVASITL